MKTYEVTVFLEATYLVDASNEDEARGMAWDWFCEATPNFEIKEVEEED